MSNDYLIDNVLFDELASSTTAGKSLFERYGGRPTLERVHKIFYDKLFAHPWLSGFFQGVNQRHIENQQSDFIAQLTGGPKVYSGRMPNHAHKHMFITEELFMVRSQLLNDALIEAGVAPTERAEWLNIDMAFKKVMIKKSIDECTKRYVDEEIVSIPNPQSSRAS